MPSKLQYCVYILLSMHDNNFCVGFTTDLQRRLTEHFHGQSPFTAPHRPFRLIFCEYFFSKEDATRREGYNTILRDDWPDVVQCAAIDPGKTP